MEKTAEYYDELVNFMHWLAHKHTDDNKALMNHDDIFGELQLEFVKSLNHYGELPRKEFINVTKRMFDNRIGELRHKYYGTHRGIPGIMASLDDSFLDDITSDDFCVEDFVESTNFVADIRSELRGIALKIFNMLIYGDERLTELLRLAGMRSSSVFSSRGTIRVKAWHIADVLTIPIAVVTTNLSNIERIVRSKL
jgi:hypothetical protein